MVKSYHPPPKHSRKTFIFCVLFVFSFFWLHGPVVCSRSTFGSHVVFAWCGLLIYNKCVALFTASPTCELATVYKHCPLPPSFPPFQQTVASAYYYLLNYINWGRLLLVSFARFFRLGGPWVSGRLTFGAHVVFAWGREEHSRAFGGVQGQVSHTAVIVGGPRWDIIGVLLALLNHSANLLDAP